MARKARIAVSVLFGLLTVALCAVWVRSYVVSDSVSIEGRGISLNAGHAVGRTGVLVRKVVPFGQPLAIYVRHHPVDVKEAHRQLQGMPSLLGFAVERSGRGLLILVPIWFLMLLSALVAAIPWRRRLPARFSLRGLLIATTLVAVVLGMLVWVGRG